MSELLQAAGSIAAVAFAALALLAPRNQVRAVAMGLALALSVALIAGEAWEGELADLREEAVGFVALVAVAIGVVAALAAAFARWRFLLPLAALAALPVRVPVEAGGETSNLLVPLYAVIAAGAAVALADAVRDPLRRPLAVPRSLPAAFAAALVLYGVQAAYSEDLGFAARNVGFFLAPFAVLFVLLAEVEWTPRLLGLGLAVLGAEAVVFATIGIVQHEAGGIFWNDALESSNDFHFYFRVNSLFWDPNIYGRYLALAAVLLCALLLWSRGERRAAWLAVPVFVIWTGLLLGFSQTSFISLLAGLAVLAALRWSLRWTAVAATLVAAATVSAVLLIADEEKSERGRAAGLTSGRSTLIEGGLELAQERPLIGHGSASFSEAFRKAEDVPEGRTTISHNEPVTVAAEQGAAGLIAYAALIGVALLTLLSDLRSVAPGLSAGVTVVSPRSPEGTIAVARIAIAAAFGVLLVHTIGYAGYLTDPLTWVLLAIGGALAVAARR